MNFGSILDIIKKAQTVAGVLIAAGKDTGPAWEAIKNLFKSKETITQTDLDDADKTLDELLEEFNAELPPP